MIQTNDTAVSPIVGTLMILALSVVLACIVSAFVFGMVGQPTKLKLVAATVQQPDTSHIIVTYHGGMDAGAFASGNVSVNSGCGYTCQPKNCHLKSAVGSTVLLESDESGGFKGQDRVIVTGKFADGGRQVMLETNI